MATWDGSWRNTTTFLSKPHGNLRWKLSQHYYAFETRNKLESPPNLQSSKCVRHNVVWIEWCTDVLGSEIHHIQHMQCHSPNNELVLLTPDGIQPRRSRRLLEEPRREPKTGSCPSWVARAAQQERSDSPIAEPPVSVMLRYWNTTNAHPEPLRLYRRTTKCFWATLYNVNMFVSGLQTLTYTLQLVWKAPIWKSIKRIPCPWSICDVSSCWGAWRN